MATWAYRLLRGKEGAEGCIRAVGEGSVLTARGLEAGGRYTICALEGAETEWPCQADQGGMLTFSGLLPEAVFVARAGRIVLWEKGEEGFSLAADRLKRKQTAPYKGANVPVPLPPDPENPDESEAPQAQAASLAENALETSFPSLRAPGEKAPVDALPALQWPAGTESIRAWAAMYPPIAPLDAPGWRFVRAPSPLRQAAYCAVGYLVRQDRVAAIAYAVPGTPHRPPAPLPGYQYHKGRRGMGYWVYWKWFQ